jgi:hypothetical protein
MALRRRNFRAHVPAEQSRREKHTVTLPARHLPVTLRRQLVRVVMNTTHGAFQEPQKIVVRDGLELVVPSAMLIRLVYEATAHRSWADSAPSRLDDTPDIVLRSVLTYCYAVGVFSSTDIEAAACHDPAIRYLCANHRPRWQIIRDFRRRNMPGLKLAVGNLLHLAARCFQREFFLRHQHQAEAASRLFRAIQADSYALDV